MKGVNYWKARLRDEQVMTGHERLRGNERTKLERLRDEQEMTGHERLRAEMKGLNWKG